MIYMHVIFPDKYSEKTDIQVIINTEQTIQTHSSSSHIQLFAYAVTNFFLKQRSVGFLDMLCNFLEKIIILNETLS